MNRLRNPVGQRTNPGQAVLSRRNEGAIGSGTAAAVAGLAARRSL